MHWKSETIISKQTEECNPNFGLIMIDSYLTTGFSYEISDKRNSIDRFRLFFFLQQQWNIRVCNFAFQLLYVVSLGRLVEIFKIAKPQRVKAERQLKLILLYFDVGWKFNILLKSIRFRMKHSTLSMHPSMSG